MTDQVCMHGRTSNEECLLCPGALNTRPKDPSDVLNRTPINREQIMLGDITDLRERVSDLERQLAKRGNVRMISVQAGSVYEDKIACGCGRWHHFVVHAVLPAPSSEPVQTTDEVPDLGDSPTRSDRLRRASGSEPFDLQRKLNEAMQIPTNPKMYEGPFGLDPTDVRVHNVLSVLRSTAFREWANGRVWIEAKIDGDGWDVLFGEVES